MIDSSEAPASTFPAPARSSRLARRAAALALAAACAAPLAHAQPFACDGEFYQFRRINNAASTLFRIDRSASPYTSVPIFDLGTFVANEPINGVGYNPVDDHIYGLRNPTNATVALYRFDTAGPVDLNGAAAGYGILVSGLPASAAFDGADIDAAGNYFASRGGTGPLYRITGITGAAPTPVATAVTSAADASPPPGYAGVTAFQIGDIAVNPAESTPSLTVMYGVRTGEPTTVYLYRLAISNPSGTAPSVAISRIATTLPATTFGSVFIDSTGAFYAYDNSANASGGFYTVDLATGAVVSVSGASSAQSSDGATCAFTPNTIDVVKAAGAVVPVTATTFDVPYTLRVGNLGSVAAPNVQVTDNLAQTFATGAPTLSIVAGPSVTAGTCTANAAFDGTAITSLLGGTDTLVAGATCTITLTVRVAYAAIADVPTSPQLNTAYASVLGTGPNPGYTFPGGLPVPPPGVLAGDTSTNTAALPSTANGDTASPTPVGFPVADLAVTKDNGTTALAPGDTTTYTIVASNLGPSAADGATITDPVAPGLAKTAVSCVPTTGAATCPPGLSVVTLQGGTAIPSFPAGSSLTFTVQANVTATTGTVTNTVTITPHDVPGDPDLSNNSASDTDTISEIADVSVVKTGPATAQSGDDVTYTLVVANAGPSDAAGVVLADPTPAGLVFVSATAPCAGGFPCTLGTLVAGASTTLSATFTVTAGEGSVINIAEVSSATPDADPSNNRSTATTVVTPVGTPSADLAVVKSGPAQATAGATVTYTLVASNLGPDAVPDAVLADPLPAGLAFVSATAPCTSGFPCTLGALGVGDTHTITVTYTVLDGFAGTITNTATIGSPSVPDPDLDNNTDTITTLVPVEPQGPGDAVALPVDARLALGMLAMLLAFAGLRRMRRG